MCGCQSINSVSLFREHWCASLIWCLASTWSQVSSAQQPLRCQQGASSEVTWLVDERGAVWFSPPELSPASGSLSLPGYRAQVTMRWELRKQSPEPVTIKEAVLGVLKTACGLQIRRCAPGPRNRVCQRKGKRGKGWRLVTGWLRNAAHIYGELMMGLALSIVSLNPQNKPLKEALLCPLNRWRNRLSELKWLIQYLTASKERSGTWMTLKQGFCTIRQAGDQAGG